MMFVEYNDGINDVYVLYMVLVYGYLQMFMDVYGHLIQEIQVWSGDINYICLPAKMDWWPAPNWWENKPTFEHGTKKKKHAHIEDMAHRTPYFLKGHSTYQPELFA